MSLRNINLLDELDNLSKIHNLSREDIDEIMLEMAKKITFILDIERVNAWVFNKNSNELVSIGEYDKRDDQFQRDNILYKEDMPNYFNALIENKILHIEDIRNHEYTKELNKVYSIPHDIFSLLDIPLRISGKLVGVMCFEKTGQPKKFHEDEIKFCFSASLVLASNLESRGRRAAQFQLEKALSEKDNLIKEINHRVKNNLSILISLMRLSQDRAGQNETKVLLEEYEQRIFSMLKIHDMLNRNNQYTSIYLTDYLNELILEFRITYPQLSDRFRMDIDPMKYMLSTEKVIHLGLIVSEIILNSIKYASDAKDYWISIVLKPTDASQIRLEISDNGKGFDFETVVKNSTLGLPLIKDLAENLDLKPSFPTENHCSYTFLMAI